MRNPTIYFVSLAAVWVLLAAILVLIASGSMMMAFGLLCFQIVIGAIGVYAGT